MADLNAVASVSGAFSEVITMNQPSRGPVVDAAQRRYDATRSHKALVRLQDAVKAQLKAEIENAKYARIHR